VCVFVKQSTRCRVFVIEKLVDKMSCVCFCETCRQVVVFVHDSETCRQYVMCVFMCVIVKLVDKISCVCACETCRQDVVCVRDSETCRQDVMCVCVFVNETC
jgi:hypothetical protein